MKFCLKDVPVMIYVELFSGSIAVVISKNVGQLYITVIWQKQIKLAIISILLAYFSYDACFF